MLKKIYQLSIFLIIFPSFLVKAQEYNPSEVLVKFNVKDNKAVTAFLEKIKPSSFEALFPKADHELNLIYKLKFTSDSDIQSIVYKCKNDPIIQYAQPNFYNQLAEKVDKPNDFFYTNQWALEKIDLRRAWGIEKGSEDIIIAVVDTGVDYNHEDLRSRIWINKREIPNNNIDDDGNGYIDDIIGWDFFDSPETKLKIDHIDRDNDPMDEDGHGTHIAGIIAGIPNNSIGIAGITWGCKIMPLRAGSKILEDDDLASAIVYAVENGANIINMSWGDDNLSFVIRDVTEYAYRKGCVLVGAVGNDDEQKIIYPANFNHVIAVGATNKADKKASFSNYGTGIDILAPGERVFGTVPNNSYSDWSGTSMATPIVSGVIALMLSKRRGLTNQEIVQILRQSADRIDEPKFERIGRVNAYKALLATLNITAKISSPQNESGTDKTMTIIGTAGGPSFKRYELDYSSTKEPSKWYRIKIGFEPIYEDIIAQWTTLHFAEGNYTLRLRCFDQNGMIAEDRIKVLIDHTPPIILEHKCNIRIINDRVKTVLSIRTDDATTVVVYYILDNFDIGPKEFYLPSVGKKHELDLTDNFGRDVVSNFSYYIKAINTAGLSTDNFNEGFSHINISSVYIPQSGFIGKKTAIPVIYPIGIADFNGNGVDEIVGMEKPNWDYSFVKIFEETESGLYFQVFKSDYEYYPQDIGDTDGDGLLEILGNRGDRTFLVESPSKWSYPTKKIWECEDLWGGQIDDLDLDGKKEIISSNIKNKSIDIFENRGNDKYLRVARLKNTTDGDNLNAVKFAIGDFDSDNGKEIAFGDSDGDLLVYKCFDDDNYKLVWTGKINCISIKSLVSGDFDGDGNYEFAVVGELIQSSYNVNKIYAYSVFDYSLKYLEYQEVYSVQIIGTKEGCGISTGDIDNDFIDEILAIVGDSAYIIKFSENEKMPYIWYSPASYTNKIFVGDVNKDGIKELFFNVDDELTVFNFDTDMSIRPPWKLKATVFDESDIELTWYGQTDSIAYKIYRGTDESDLKHISTLSSSNYSKQMNVGKWIYRDKGLIQDVKYWYALTSIDKDGNESQFSNKVSILLDRNVYIVSAEYKHPRVLYVTFSKQITLPSNETNHFYIETETLSVNPISAILDRDDRRVILNLPILQAGNYVLYVYNVTDKDGNPIRFDKNSIRFIIPISDQDNYYDLKQMKVFPNPVTAGRSEKVQFHYLPNDSIIRIFDLNGHLINTVKTEQNKAEWYLDNDSGEKIASGVYIYFIDSNSGRKAGKIAVIR